MLYFAMQFLKFWYSISCFVFMYVMFIFFLFFVISFSMAELPYSQLIMQQKCFSKNIYDEDAYGKNT